MRWYVALVLASGVAHAEPEPAPLPFGVVATAGIGTAAVSQFEDDYEPITAMQLDVGWRFRNVMLGLHVGLQSGSLYKVSHYMSMYDDHWLYTYRPMPIAITSHYVVQDRFYAAPWLGLLSGWRRQECYTKSTEGTTCEPLDWQFVIETPAWGFTLGADAVEVNGHRLTITAALIRTYNIGNAELDYTSVSLGVGYRFWDR